jgi:iron complex transport system ATP-binding protein
MKLLEATGLSVKFGNKTILNNINFCMNEGEFIGLIGPNGSGKTTLLRTLSGILPENAKKIKILGRSLSDCNRKQLAQKLAYLPQGNESYWSITVESLVMLGRLPHRKPWQGPSDLDKKIVQQVLQDCDVSQFANSTVDTLSGGERARVFLSRALAVQPQLLLVDEPIAGLDPGHQLEVMQKFRQFSELGMGIVCVIHDLTLAARYCHKLIMLGEQKIISQGQPDQVLSSENLARCFNIRAHVGEVEGHAFVIPIARCQI